jgi:hypothetical protein
MKVPKRREAEFRTQDEVKYNAVIADGGKLTNVRSLS